MMFIWKRSNNRREAKYNTCLLLAARLFNAYYILSRLLLPSFITLAKKNKFFISTIFLPHFFPAILVSKPSDRNKVAFTFPLEFDLIRFDVWVNAELNYLGRPKVVFGSAHVKFDVLIGPYRYWEFRNDARPNFLATKLSDTREREVMKFGVKLVQ